MQPSLPFDDLPPGGKRCVLCKQLKPRSQFNRRKRSVDGLQTVCRECNRTSSSRYYRDNRVKHLGVVKERRMRLLRENQERLVRYLSTHPCVDCGETDVVVLEFDHLRDKFKAVSLLLSLGHCWETISEEIEKCEVRCANCHRRRTARQRNYYRLTFRRADSEHR